MEKAEMQVQEEFANNCTFHPKVSVFHSSYCLVIYLCPCAKPCIDNNHPILFRLNPMSTPIEDTFLLKWSFHSSGFSLIALNKVAGNVLNRLQGLVLHFSIVRASKGGNR